MCRIGFFTKKIATTDIQTLKGKPSELGSYAVAVWDSVTDVRMLNVLMNLHCVCHRRIRLEFGGQSSVQKKNKDGTPKNAIVVTLEDGSKYEVHMQNAAHTKESGF